MGVRRFFRTPKGLLTIVLVAFVAMAAPHEGILIVARDVASAILIAGLIDGIILRTKRRRWVFPSGAVLTALFVAMILSAQTPWRVVCITSALAVGSKYIFRTRAGNVFNPAALALVVLFPVFHAGQSWWGALPDVAPILQVLLVASGVFIADRVNRMPLVLAFLGAYYLLFTVTAFVSDPAWVTEVFRAPDLEAVLFFAFFILTDPPTSPIKYGDQLMFAVLVAVVSFAIFEWMGAVYYLLAGVLVGNVWEAWRRVTHRTGATFPRGVGRFLREITPWRAESPARPLRGQT